MYLNNERNRAWILGMCESGLTAIRSLGRAGIPVTGVDCNPNELGRFSRFGRFEYAPSPVENPQALLDWFIQTGKKNPLPGVILPATDAYVAFISKYRDILTPYFIFALPPVHIMDALLDKYLHVCMAENMGEKIPLTFLIDENADLDVISRQLHFPAFIKARFTHLWKQVYTNKGFKVNTQEEFIQVCDQIIQKKLTAIVQDIIAAPITNHFEVNFYRSIQPGNPILAMIEVRKIRQYPPELGCGSLMETFENSDVKNRTIQFAERIDFQGIGNIEYIYDEQARDYFLVELNARLWQQNVQADYCGINFPLIAYRDLLGESQAAIVKAEPGIKWMDPIADCRSFWEQHKSGNLGIVAWLSSLKGVKVFATFAWDDWKPILHEIVFILKYLWLHLPMLRYRNT